VNILIDEN